ncbi:MAG: hypothetical protein ACRDTT_17415, partial [Pseudonocardiaceae bacterium]
MTGRVGLTDGLSPAVGGCRSWTEHDPGKVVRDVVLIWADGGDALRHLKVLEAQPEFVRRRRVGGYGQPHDHRVSRRRVGRRAAGRRPTGGPRAGVGWGGEPPVITAARAAWEAGGRQTVFRLSMDVDATLATRWNDDRDGLRLAAATYKKGFGTHPLTSYLDRGDRSGEALAGCCARVTPAVTRPSTTSKYSRCPWPRRHSCRPTSDWSCGARNG